jgi:hypothetical protein
MITMFGIIKAYDVYNYCRREQLIAEISKAAENIDRITERIFENSK